MPTISKTWTFQSSSNPNKNYETIQYTDGSTSCNCRGWTFAKNGVRSCTHTRKVDQGIADRETLSVWENLEVIRSRSQYREQAARDAIDRNAERNMPVVSRVLGRAANAAEALSSLEPDSQAQSNLKKLARLRKQLKPKAVAVPTRALNW
jgi:hypothetical protein